MAVLLDRCLDLLFPLSCVACGARGAWLCPGCRRPARGMQVERCGLRVALAQEPADPGAIDALYALKYESVRAAGQPLIALLASALADALGTSRRVTLAPVPTDPARKRERGFDQSELLARGGGELLGIETLLVLERTRGARRQVGLGREERLANVAGMFVSRAALPDGHIVLIDDVCTTGATFAAAAAALRSSGAERISAMSLFGAIPDRKARDA